MIKDYFRMAVQNLSNRKMRSWLTMIGIFIGITAVVAIISLGQGLQVAINDQFAALGTNKIYVSPGSGFLSGGATAPKLTEKDRRTIERVPGVKDTLGFGYTSAKMTYKDQDNYALVMGITTQDGEEVWKDSWGDFLAAGRLIQKGDNSKAYLTYDYTLDKKVFPHRMQLYDNFYINNQSFQVVGFQKQVGNSGDDQTIYVTGDAFKRVFGTDLKDDYKQILIRVQDGADPALVADNVKKALRNERGVKEGEEDFTLQTAEQLMESFNSVLLIVQVVIIGIAAISLVIGGIGIMNTMYTAVVERTQEIGIMKAIGARNSDVLTIFLIESGMLGLVGGAIGVALGLGIAYAVQFLGGLYVGSPYLKAWWNWQLILGSLLFSFLAGALSGVAPAWQASKQKPVDSLRYE